MGIAWVFVIVQGLMMIVTVGTILWAWLKLQQALKIIQSLSQFMTPGQAIDEAARRKVL